MNSIEWLTQIRNPEGIASNCQVLPETTGDSIKDFEEKNISSLPKKINYSDDKRLENLRELRENPVNGQGIQNQPVLDMTFSQFQKSGLSIVIWSDLLNDHIIFRADNSNIDIPGAYQSYSVSELRELLKSSGGEFLKCLHDTKKMFAGKVIGVALTSC